MAIAKSTPKTSKKKVATTKAAVSVEKETSVKKSVATKKSTATKSTTTVKKSVAAKKVTASKPTVATKKAPAAKKVAVATKTTATKKPVAKKTLASEPVQKDVVKATPSATPVKTAVIGSGLRTVRKPTYDVVRPGGSKSVGQRAPRLPKEGESHFSDADLQDFKKRLLQDRKQIVEQIQKMRAGALMPRTEENVEEDGTTTFGTTVDLDRANDQQKRIRAIDDALRAIEQKTYGICQTCGCLIPRDRLRAAPFAIRCVECKKKYEKELEVAKRAQQ